MEVLYLMYIVTAEGVPKLDEFPKISSAVKLTVITQIILYLFVNKYVA
jgi:hypothetical protein